MEVEPAAKSDSDELGVGTSVENVESKPAPVTMTQIVKLIADIHTLSNKVNISVQLINFSLM